MIDVARNLPPGDRQLRKMLFATVLAAVLLVAGRAHATPIAEATAPAASGEAFSSHGENEHKRTVLRFGEDDIHGDLTRPDGELVQAPRKPAQSSLLRVRKNFLDRALSGAARGQ